MALSKSYIINEVYTGQTKQFGMNRWKGHVIGSLNDNHSDKSRRFLHQAMYRYGHQSFVLIPLQYIYHGEDFTKNENKWMFRLNTVFPNGYNAHYEGKPHTPARRGGKEVMRKIKGSLHHLEKSVNMGINTELVKSRTFISHGQLLAAALALKSFAFGGKQSHAGKSHLKKMKIGRLGDILQYIQQRLNTEGRDTDDLCPVFILIHEFLVNRLPGREKRIGEKRHHIRIPYVTFQMDSIEWSRIVHAIISKGIPEQIACQPNVQPMVQFIYGPAITMELINNRGAAEDAVNPIENDEECTCIRALRKLHKGADISRFIGKGITCIATTGFTVVNDTKLQAWLDRGGKFRRVAAVNPVPPKTGGKVSPWEELIEKQLKPWTKSLTDRGISKTVAEMTKNEIALSLANKIEEVLASKNLTNLPDEGPADCKNYQSFNSFNSKSPMLLVGADKLSDRLVIICRKEYNRVCFQQVNDRSSFKVVQEEESKIVDRVSD